MGIQQLSIVDASVIPLLVAATLQASVYAVAEKVRTVYRSSSLNFEVLAVDANYFLQLGC